VSLFDAQKLQQREANGVNSTNTTVSHSNDRTDASKLNLPEADNKAPAPIDPSIDKWFFISGAAV